MRNHLILGNYNALCDSCGRKFKALDLKKRWDGLMVCKEDYELRHNSDFLRVQKEKISVPFSRPYPVADTFTGYICSIIEIRPYADIASADCARVDLALPYETAETESLWLYVGSYPSIAGLAVAGYSVPGIAYSLAPQY
jgi:hypothetical protein